MPSTTIASATLAHLAQRLVLMIESFESFLDSRNARRMLRHSQAIEK